MRHVLYGQACLGDLVSGHGPVCVSNKYNQIFSVPARIFDYHSQQNILYFSNSYVQKENQLAKKVGRSLAERKNIEEEKYRRGKISKRKNIETF